MWLAIGLAAGAALMLILGLAVTGITGAALNRVYRRGGWRKKMLIAIGTVAGALCGLFGSMLALGSYELDRKEAEVRKEDEAALRASVAVAHQELSETNRELSAARARSDELERRRERQTAKLANVTRRIAQAMSEGDTIRYKIEDARNKDFKKFTQEFESVHEKAVEDWREKTAKMLDEELPNLNLGPSFSVIDGDRGYTQDVFLLTRLLKCIADLRTTQASLPTLVSQVMK
jgi:hypothetical protein